MLHNYKYMSSKVHIGFGHGCKRINKSRLDCLEHNDLITHNDFDKNSTIMTDIDKIIEEVSNEHPYKERGNPDSYSLYNEGWCDACDRLGEKIKQSLVSSNGAGRSEQLGCNFCGAGKGLKHGYMPDGEPCPMDKTV